MIYLEIMKHEPAGVDELAVAGTAGGVRFEATS